MFPQLRIENPTFFFLALIAAMVGLGSSRSALSDSIHNKENIVYLRSSPTTGETLRVIREEKKEHPDSSIWGDTLTVTYYKIILLEPNKTELSFTNETIERILPGNLLAVKEDGLFCLKSTQATSLVRPDDRELPLDLAKDALQILSSIDHIQSLPQNGKPDTTAADKLKDKIGQLQTLCDGHVKAVENEISSKLSGVVKSRIPEHSVTSETTALEKGPDSVADQQAESTAPVSATSSEVSIPR